VGKPAGEVLIPDETSVLFRFSINLVRRPWKKDSGYRDIAALFPPGDSSQNAGVIPDKQTTHKKGIY
jgi:hypothetical protein